MLLPTSSHRLHGAACFCLQAHIDYVVLFLFVSLTTGSHRLRGAASVCVSSARHSVQCTGARCTHCTLYFARRARNSAKFRRLSFGEPNKEIVAEI